MQRSIQMDSKDQSSTPAEEPIGIVISRGKRDEPAPAFRAYIWGPAPEEEMSILERSAA